MEGFLKVTVSNPEGKEVGFFLIPCDAPLEWLKKNLPTLIRGAQILAGFKPEDLDETLLPEQVSLKEETLGT